MFSMLLWVFVLSESLLIELHLFFFKFYLFIYLWLCWVFVSVRGLSLVAASGDHSSSRCAGLSLSRPLLLRSTGSATVAHGPSRSAACGIFPDQGSNLCSLHWQADSQPLRHQGSPELHLYVKCWGRGREEHMCLCTAVMSSQWIQLVQTVCNGPYH